MEQQTGSKSEKEYVKAVYCHPAYVASMQSTSWETRTGRNTSWNQDCREKYQSPQICRWHHPYGRKWRGTKKPLNESESGKWKSWLKAQHSENKDHGIWSHHFMGNRWGNSGNSVRLYFLGSIITADGDCSYEVKRCLLLGRKVMTNLDSVLKSRDTTLPTKVHLVKAMVFPVVLYGCELDYKESWSLKNWCFWTVVLEKALESSLDCKDIQIVHPKGDQSWVFIGSTDVKAETPILWPFHGKSWLTGKDSDAGRD